MPGSGTSLATREAVRAEALETLGRYRLGECLATGGMAQVFAAHPVDGGAFDRPIVVKRMLPHLAGNARFVSMFVQEARISSRLDHPNIVKVLDFEASDGGLFLVMEYVDGPDLLALLKAAALRAGAIAAPIAAYVCSHVLEALDYAHNLVDGGRHLRLIHRDVSPSNILLDRRGRIKLADFGIARASERQEATATGTLNGKYGYMSPEQVCGAPLDARSDLFSVGVVLAELVMGRRLFVAPTDLELLLMVKGAVLDRLDRHGAHIPSELRAIIGRALAREPGDRYATAAAFRDALIEWMLSAPERTGAHQLGALIDGLGLEGADSGAWDAARHHTLSGDTTRAEREAAISNAAAGRRIFATGGAEVTPQPQALFQDLSLTPISLEGATVPDPLAALPALEAIIAIAEGRGTGGFTAVRDNDCKQIYFVDGQPDFAQSNIHSERFGEFLVRRDVISRAALTRALAASPTFGGRLAETLVALELIRPIDAVAWLERQTCERLLELATWRTGHFYWEEGAIADVPKVSLRLSTLAVLGEMIWRYPREVLRGWARERASSCPAATPHPTIALSELAFDPELEQGIAGLDGSLPLRVLANRIADADDRYAYFAALVILERLGLVTL